MTTNQPGASALDRLRALIEAQVALGFRKQGRYYVPDLAEATKAEKEVFDLPLSDMPRLAATYWAWDIACRTIDENLYGEPGLVEALREIPIVQKGSEAFHRNRAHPDFLASWIEFARLLGVPYRPALAFFWKNCFYEMRRGHFTYDDGYYGPETAEPGEARPF